LLLRKAAVHVLGREAVLDESARSLALFLLPDEGLLNVELGKDLISFKI
jgi:hypothetical protein